MRYLLDANILSYAEEKASVFHESVRSALAALSNDDEVLLSVITLYELEFRVANAQEKERLEEMVKLSEECFELLPIPRKGAKIFGDIKAKYREMKRITKKTDLTKHNVDFILASSAIAENLVLVSNDRIFQEIREVDQNLRLENWTVA